MAVTLKLDGPLSAKEELWLAKNVGPRLHYIHNSVGGQGWIAKQHNEQVIKETSDGEVYTTHQRAWKLTLQDEKFASWFTLMFPQ
jgi:hypothetical protein